MKIVGFLTIGIFQFSIAGLTQAGITADPDKKTIQITVNDAEKLVPLPLEKQKLSCTALVNLKGKNTLYRNTKIYSSKPYPFTIMNYAHHTKTDIANLSCTYLTEDRKHTKDKKQYCQVQCCNSGTIFNLTSCKLCGSASKRVNCHDY